MATLCVSIVLSFCRNKFRSLLNALDKECIQKVFLLAATSSNWRVCREEGVVVGESGGVGWEGRCCGKSILC